MIKPVTSASRAEPAWQWISERAWARYAIAMAASALAIGLTALASSYVGERVFIVAYVAIAVSGTLGFGPGALASVLCVLGIHYLTIALENPPGGSGATDVLALGIFLLVALIISGLAARAERSRGVAKSRQKEAEGLAHAMQLQANELKHQATMLEQHKKQLEAAEAFNRSVVESLADPMVVHDADWRFQYINAAAAQMFRTSKHQLPASLIGANLWELYPDIINTDFGINLMRAATERRQIGFEAYYPERGEWSDLRCYPLPNGGLVTLWKNITERRQKEEAERYLSSASAILGKSLDYNETLQALAQLVVPDLADWCRVDMLEDDGSLRLLAVAHVDPEKVGWARELARRYPPNMGAPTGIPNVLRTGVAEIHTDITEEMLAQNIADPEYLALLKTVQFRGVIMAPIPAGGLAVGVLTLVSAESRRKYTESDLLLAVELARRAGMSVQNARVHSAEKLARESAVSAQRAAEEANATKSQFLAFMSHELRTPLNAIAGYVDLLLAGVHGELSSAQQSALERVKRSQRVLLGLINNVLNFVKLEAGHVEFTMEDARAADILKDVETLVIPQLDAKGLRYDFKCDKGATVHADPEKTQQILLNLLSNAIKFTDSGGEVTVSCARDTAGVSFTVRDTGCGIPVDKQNAVFEPFVQLDRTLKSPREGTGLGLAISRELAVQMHGSLTLQSTVGDGCVFRLMLPAGKKN